MHILKHLGPILLAASLAACASTPNQNFSQHSLTVNGDGDVRVPNDQTEPRCPGKPKSIGFSLVTPEGYQAQVESLFDAAEKNNPSKNLLIFVHGGLNTLSNSTDRVNELIDRFCGGGLNGYYPILVNWDSGFFESYAEHLFQVRQGEINPPVAIPTSPLYFMADVGRGIVRSPIDILYTSYRDSQAIPFIQDTTNTFKKNSDDIYTKLRVKYPKNISRGCDIDWGWQTVEKTSVNLITWLPQLVLSPAVDAFGTPAWDAMKRRATVLYNKPEEFDVRDNKGGVDDAIQGKPFGVMGYFAQRLAEYSARYPNATITIVGHSMGTFIINQILQKNPDIRLNNIVYMAGADSVRNTFASVLPYLRKNIKANFYNLTLHPQSEVEEANYFVFPRGSLLVWIDDFFSTPLSQFDRTVGRWENIIQAYGEIQKEDDQVRGRIFIKAFDQTSAIEKHGDFSNALFWLPEFWQPGPDGHNPWDSETGFYTHAGPAPLLSGKCKLL